VGFLPEAGVSSFDVKRFYYFACGTVLLRFRRRPTQSLGAWDGRNMTNFKPSQFR
jgi:hypothetical protein